MNYSQTGRASYYVSWLYCAETDEFYSGPIESNLPTFTMFRPNRPSLNPLAAPTAHLLPSERTALAETAPAPSTPASKNGSRNDLFSFDWSPVMPNVISSRSATPTKPDKSTRTPPRISIDIPTPSLAILDLPLPPPSPHSLQPTAPYTPPVSPHTRPLSPTSKTHSLLNTSVSHSISPPPSLASPNRSSFPISPPIQSHDLLEPTPPPPIPYEGGQDSIDPILDSRRRLRLRLSPTREYFLGEGRHATVFLASFMTESSSTEDATLPEETTRWQLCAAKRYSPDRASQISGLGEAFILSRLQALPSVLKLYGVKDERDGIESPDAARSRRGSHDLRSEIGLGRPGGAAQFHHQHPLQTRSISEAAQQDSSRLLPLRRQASFNSRSYFSKLVPPVGSPTLDASGEFATLGDVGQEGGRREMVKRDAKRGPRYSEPAAPRKMSKDSSAVAVEPAAQEYDWEKGVSVRRGSSVKHRPVAPILDTISPTNSPTDPPRIILLLEYCRFGDLLGFLKQYPERMGRKRWLDWAKQIAMAVSCCHERSILHADIKPQNVLVRIPTSSDVTPR